MSEPLQFWAEVIRVSTMESGAIRVVLDLPEHETVLMAQLAECKRRGAVLDVTAEPRFEKDEVEKSYGL